MALPLPAPGTRPARGSFSSPPLTCWGTSGKVGITLRVPVEELYVAEGHRGVCVLWMASVQIADEANENYGKWITCEGVSGFEFNDEGEVTLEVDYHHGPQGLADSWVAHWNARRARPWAELGEISGA